MVLNDQWVSVWVGSASNEESLQRVLSLAYTEDGDVTPSPIMVQTGMGLYDEACVETELRGGHFSNWEEALEGHSYLDSFLSDLKRSATPRPDPSDKAFVLFYGTPFTGDIPAYSDDSVQLRLIGSFRYHLA